MKNASGADRVYKRYVDGDVYFVERDGIIVAYNSLGEKVDHPFTIGAGWYVWKVREDGEVYDMKVINV